MGIVYFCLDQEQNNLPVAIKTFKPEYLSDRNSRERFLREAAIWVNLEFHVNIVQAYKVLHVAEDQSVFIILQMMPTLQGKKDPSLRSWLIPGQPMPLAQSLNFFLGCVRGMKYAEGKIPGFVHRDLKPENILIGPDYTPKITDFGIARINNDEDDGPKYLIPDSRNLKSVMGMGTPLYMSPEQWLTPKVDCRSDIYALGCVLYEMLVGEIAIGFDGLKYMPNAHLKGVPLAKVKSSGFPEPLKNFLIKCVHPDPAMRFARWIYLETEIIALYNLILNQVPPEEESGIDVSLQKLLQEAESYLAIGSSYVNLSHFSAAIEYFQKASEIAKEQKFYHVYALSEADQGVACSNMGLFTDAIHHYEEAIRIFKLLGEPYQVALHSGNLGNAYLGMFDLDVAKKYLETAVNLFKKMNDPHSLSIWMGNLGTYYASKRDYKTALAQFQNALLINPNTKDQSNEIKLLVNIGTTFADLGNVKKSTEYITNAINLARQIGDRQAEGQCYMALSGPLTKSKKVTEALHALDYALTIGREIGDQLTIAKSLSNSALLILSKKLSENAETMLKEAIQIADRIDARDVSARSNWTLGLYYEMTGWNSKAIDHLRTAVIKFRDLNMMEYDQAAAHLLKLRKRLGLI